MNASRFVFAGLFFLCMCDPGYAVVIDFASSYQGTTPSAGWSYLYNKNGDIGTAANYTPLAWNSTSNVYSVSATAWPAGSPYGYLAIYYGSGFYRVIPGNGMGQGASHPYYAISSYTVQDGQGGTASITGSSLTIGNTASDGVDVLVYVNDVQKYSGVISGGATGSFNCNLGTIATGDKVFVAVGPGSSATSTGNSDNGRAFGYQINSITPINMYWSGSGTWNTTNLNWGTITGGSYASSWASGNNAVFEGTAGTVTLASAYPSVNSLTFNTTDYSVVGGTLSLSGKNVTTDSGINATISTTIDAASGLTKLGDGALVISGANTYAGATTVNGGTLSLSGGSAISDSGAVVLANTAGVVLNLASSETIGSLSGGGTTGGNVALNANTLTVGGTASTTFAGAISGAGGLTKAGTGSLALSGANTYAGGTNINAGTLSLASSGAIGDSGTIAFNGGMLQFTSSNTIDYSSRFSTAGDQAYKIDTNGQTVAIASALTSNGGSLTKTGSGILVLTGNNTYTGGTTISGGRLSLASSSAIGSTGTVSFNGGTLQYTSSNTTDYSSRFSSADNQAYSIDTNGQNVTLASAMTSSGGSLTKVGKGVLTLTGANTYTGLTTVNAGTLKLDFADSSAPTSNILGSSSTLSTNNSILLIQGKAGSANTQSFAGFKGGVGETAFTVASGAGGSMNVSLGAITYDWCSHTDFSLPTNGAVTTTSANTDYSTVGGQQSILSGWATVGQNTWAVSGSGAAAGAISGLTVYSNSFTAAADVDAPTGTSTPASMTINSLRFNNAADATVNVGGGSGTLLIASGGILVTSNVGNHAIVINAGAIGSQNGGTSKYALGNYMSTLEVIQNNTASTLTITGASNTSAAPVWAIDKFGDGTLILEGNSDCKYYNVVKGKLVLHNASNITPFWITMANDAALVFDQESTDLICSKVIKSSSYGTSSLDTFGGGGAGVVKTGAYKLTLSGANTYVGGTTVEEGELSITSAFLSDTANVSVASGASLSLDFTGADTIAALYLNGSAVDIGIWGAIGSGAEHTSNYLAGTGLLNVTVIPEPSVLVILATGLIGLIAYAWRRRK